MPLQPGAATLPPAPVSATYPTIPVLVISGELDNMTTIEDGAAAAAHFPQAHQIVIDNSFHVNALPHARSPCAAILVRRFIETLDAGDESCASTVPPVRLIPAFARHVAEVAPAGPLSGNNGDNLGLRIVTATLFTAEDVLIRAGQIGTGSGVGLRGGAFTVQSTPTGYHLQLRDIRWTEDLSVSGLINQSHHGAEIHAVLQLRGPHDATGQLMLQWSEANPGTPAAAHGKLNGKAIVAEATAP